MKLAKYMLSLQWMILCLAMVGCSRNTDDVWDNTKTCGRHMNRGFRTLGGKSGDSRAVRCRDEFYYAEAPSASTYFEESSPVGMDYVPLTDESRGNDMGAMEVTTQQPRETPGDPGSSVPGIEAFQDPSTNSQLAGVFKNLHFDYNQSLVKGDNNLETMRKVTAYMMQHPNTYLFVEGHCDERGPEAYNLALGTRRAHAVRDTLVNNGVNPDHVFTISYGKERPLIHDHHEEAWAQNRRAEFKIYQR